MSPEERDKLILALAQPQWRKVAFIVAAVGAAMKEPTDENYDALAVRVVALVEAGKLEARGDLSEWRRSEVRLPQN